MTAHRPPSRGAVLSNAQFAALAVLLLAGVLVIALTTDGAALRVVGGIAFVVAVGASITAVLRVGSEDRVERAALALGLGLSAMIVGGLLLDVVDALDPLGWIGFGVLVLGLGLLAAARSPSRTSRTADRDVAGGTPTRPTSTALVVLTATVCVVAVVVALSIAVDSAHEQTGEGFTALAIDVPSEREPTIGVVVENRERIAATYRVVASVDGEEVFAIDDLQLTADESRRLDVPIEGIPSGTQVVVSLYRDGSADVYRKVSMTVP
jgi:hypothetical protein